MWVSHLCEKDNDGKASANDAPVQQKDDEEEEGDYIKSSDMRALFLP